jgi:sulfatase maturation enzyme AslB (radical SAM superfamily)
MKENNSKKDTEAKDKLISVKPKLKIKGFNKENIGIIALTKEDLQIRQRITRLSSTPFYNDLSENHKILVSKITNGYQNTLEGKELEEDQYILSEHELVEFENIHDWEVFRYLVYRYKYNMYPKLKIVDEYPPCVQIEPVSMCNFKCVFCYQSDKSFSNKSSGHMGYMELDLFKKVVDELEGNVESITLASRGEPTLHKQLGEMLDYMRGKFLAVKINSNASLLTDKLIHTILSSDIQTMAFSIDAADKELYEKLRVNGKFEKTLRNVERFNEIREKEYPNSRLTTRISGVKVNEDQDVQKMVDLWAPYADIIAFTNYTPWESSYENPINDVSIPCTELWRRLFVWWDGKVNPCDYDYKSLLSKWSASKTPISEIWNSDYYKMLRTKHLNDERKELEPCKKCMSA